jgi:hypothetical protein
MSEQFGWQFCRVCEGLFFAAGENTEDDIPGGICFGFNPHVGTDAFGVGNQAGSGPTQGGWRFCSRCHGMHFADAPPGEFGGGARRMCFGTFFDGEQDLGLHDPSQSDHYVLEIGDGSHVPFRLGGWRFCKKCFMLCFAPPGEPNNGHCPAGGTHDHSGSAHYMLHPEPVQEPVPPLPPPTHQ